MFPDSYPIAVRRLQSLEKRLDRDQKLKKKVVLLIEEYEEKGLRTQNHSGGVTLRTHEKAFDSLDSMKEAEQLVKEVKHVSCTLMEGSRKYGTSF